MPDYKKLCAELVEKLDELNCHYNVPNQSAMIERARVALDEPEPEGPTREEIYHLMYEFTIGTGHGERLDEIGFAHALLARWGK